MSRDGYLPPGVTEADVDRACPGYDDEPNPIEKFHENRERDRKALEDTFEHLREANDHIWLEIKLTEMLLSLTGRGS